MTDPIVPMAVPSDASIVMQQKATVLISGETQQFSNNNNDGFVNEIPFTLDDNDIMNDLFCAWDESSLPLQQECAHISSTDSVATGVSIGAVQDAAVPMAVFSSFPPPQLESGSEGTQFYALPIKEARSAVSLNSDDEAASGTNRRDGKLTSVAQKRVRNSKHARNSRLRKTRFLEALHKRVDALKEQSNGLQNILRTHVGEKKTETVLKATGFKTSGGNVREIPQERRSGILDALQRAQHAYRHAIQKGDIAPVHQQPQPPALADRDGLLSKFHDNVTNEEISKSVKECYLSFAE